MSEAGFLADTHVLLWTLAGDPRRRTHHDAMLANPVVPVFFSAVSVVEISIKTSQGKLTLDCDLMEELRQLGITELPLTWKHARAVEELPLIHRDPFDRMLIAQAKVEGLTLMTSDKHILQYDIETC